MIFFIDLKYLKTKHAITQKFHPFILKVKITTVQCLLYSLLTSANLFIFSKLSVLAAAINFSTFKPRLQSAPVQTVLRCISTQKLTKPSIFSGEVAVWRKFFMKLFFNFFFYAKKFHTKYLHKNSKISSCRRHCPIIVSFFVCCSNFFKQIL